MSDQPQSPALKAPLVVQLLRHQPRQPAAAASQRDRGPGDCERAEQRSVLVNELLDRTASVNS